MEYLTAIITFANEKEEVERTIKSLKKYSPIELPIILINDASDDGFDYDFIEKKYSLLYIKNKKRIGVAACRDIGVAACKTLFFILLDAHMRFYENNWHSEVVNVLLDNEKTLLCCQTKNIGKDKKEKRIKPIGAKFIISSETKTLEAEWNYIEKYQDSQIENIPCVLGATYATSKLYWIRLKGLSGLLSYGGDEPYISIKVWLEGGKCILLKNITIGHLYRKRYPYNFNDSHYLYNKMLIAELLIPSKLKGRIISKLKWHYREYPDIFRKSYEMIIKNHDINSKLRKYYHTIFKHDFSYYQQLNESYSSEKNSQNEVDLDKIAIDLFLNMGQINSGLFTGSMGCVLFFQHYSIYKRDSLYENLATELLDRVYNRIDLDFPIGLENGLCGIGWGIEYLIQNHLMDGNSDDILTDIDQKLMTYNLEYISDCSLSTGITGFLHYIHVRMNKMRSDDNHIFDDNFLTIIKNVCLRLIYEENTFNGVDIAVMLLDRITLNDNVYPPPEIDDLFFNEWNSGTTYAELSLIGTVGNGIKQMNQAYEKK